MNISSAGTYIKTSAVQIARSPRTANLLRTAKSTVPFIATGAAGALLYNTSPEFKCAVDQTREVLASHPRISEMISSGIFLGVIPDFLTQRYEGNGMNFRRLASMTALGSFNGGVLTRGLYTALSYFIPGESFWENEAKIGIDQFLWCPAFYLYYFSVVNPMEGKPMESFSAIKNNIKKSLPLCWAYWGLFGAQLVYNLPNDLRIFAANLLSVLWFGFMSNMAHKQTK